MRNTPLKAFTKKGKSPLPQTFVQPDLSFLNNQVVSESDTAVPTGSAVLDSNAKVSQSIKNKFSSIPENKRHMYDNMGNFKEDLYRGGEITKTAKDRFIEKQRDANPILGTIKGFKTAYDFLKK